MEIDVDKEPNFLQSADGHLIIVQVVYSVILDYAILNNELLQLVYKV